MPTPVTTKARAARAAMTVNWVWDMPQCWGAQGVVSTTCQVLVLAICSCSAGLVTQTTTLPELLRRARHDRRLSQLELSLLVDVSTRHLGFVEVGRSRPGRALLLRWLGHLEVPLGVRNQALRLAGYADAYDESPLDAPSLVEARRALSHLLASHDPMPGVILDENWDVVAGNDSFLWLARVAGATLDLPVLSSEGEPTHAGPNLFELVLGPGGLGRNLINLEEVAPAVLQHLRHDALSNPRLESVVTRVASLVPDKPSEGTLPPTLITRYATTHGELAFLSMFTTFGTPQSISLASLRVELMFPADDPTRTVLAQR